MTRSAVVLTPIAGLAIGVIAVAVGIATASAQPATTARVFVSAKEYSFVLSRQTLAPGPARIQLYNAGEDTHDLRLRRVGGTRTLRVGEATPGNVTELKAILRRGTWRLWCSLPGHAKAGMRATLHVRGT